MCITFSNICGRNCSVVEDVFMLCSHVMFSYHVSCYVSCYVTILAYPF